MKLLWMLALFLLLSAGPTAIGQKPAAELIVQSGHNAGLRNAMYSPDGTLLVTKGDDSAIRLWDVASGDELRDLPRALRDAPTMDTQEFKPRFAISRDGSWIANGSQIWNLMTGEGRSFGPERTKIYDVAFSPDGRELLLAGTDGAHRFDFATGRELEPYKLPGASVYSLAYSADGKWLVTGTNQHSAILWDRATHQEEGRCQIDRPGIIKASVSSDASVVLILDDNGGVWLWDRRSGRRCSRLVHPASEAEVSAASLIYTPDDFMSADLSSDGQYIVTASEYPNRMELWSAKTQQVLTEKSMLDFMFVFTVAFSPDEATVVAAPALKSFSTEPIKPYFWNIATNVGVDESYRTPNAVAANGHWALVFTSARMAQYWNLRKGERLGHIVVGAGTGATAVSEDGQVVTGSDDGMLKLWDGVTGRELHHTEPDYLPITSLVFAADRRHLAVGRQDGSVEVWDSKAWTLRRRLKAHESDHNGYTTSDGKFIRDATAVTAMSFSPDSRTLVTGSRDCYVRLWDLRAGSEIGFSLYGSEAAVPAAPNSSAHREQPAKLQARASQRSLCSDNQEDDGSRALSAGISRDGRTVLAAWPNTIAVWDRKTHRMRKTSTHRDDNDTIRAVAFTADGKLVDIAHPLSQTVLDTATWKEVRSLPNKPGVEGLTISPDGTHVWIANTSALEGRDFRSGEQTLDLDPRQAALSRRPDTFGTRASRTLSAAFLPNDAGLVVYTSEELQVWDFASSRLARRIATGYRLEDPLSEELAVSPDGGTALAGRQDCVSEIALGSKPSPILEVPLSARTSLHCLATAPGPEPNPMHKARIGPILPLPEDAQKFTLVNADGREISYSPDGTRLVTASEKGDLQLWDPMKGTLVRRLQVSLKRPDSKDTNTIKSIAFSRDSSEFVVVASGSTGHFITAQDGNKNFILESSDSAVYLISAQDGSELASWSDPHGGLYCVAFARSGQLLIDTSDGLTLRNPRTGAIERQLGKSGCEAVSPNGRTYIGSAPFGLWSLDTGKLIRRFERPSSFTTVTFSRRGDKFVTTQFDQTVELWDVGTGKRLATLVGFRDGAWAVVDPSGRFDTNNLDGNASLMWRLPSDPLHELPLETFLRTDYTPRLLSRVTNGEDLGSVPAIANLKKLMRPNVLVWPHEPTSGRKDTVDVTVTVSSQADAKGNRSGIEDLRLFRDGQLVRYKPGRLASGKYQFSDVPLPMRQSRVVFSAYAFSTEHIKSATDQAPYGYEPGASASPHAYLLQIGVNHYGAAHCELNWSVNDAQKLSGVLVEKLRARGISVLTPPELLVSPTGGDAQGASKQKIRDALETIADQAKPDDLFFVSFSGHGYSDPRTGEYYLLPSDVQGDCRKVDKKFLKQAISADELTDWLRPIDAGEMAFVLDSCYSAQSVATRDFKPGPMGSRGLGQLAYDKRMRILAASQSDQTAGEYDRLRQGLLSYILTDQGLVQGLADWKPKDRHITLGEWLSYAADAVPRFKLSSLNEEAEDEQEAHDAQDSNKEIHTEGSKTKAAGPREPLHKFCDRGLID